MAIAKSDTTNTPQPYTVLRAICIDGERVDVGGTVHLTKATYTELATAGKVGPHDPEAASRTAKLPAKTRTKDDAAPKAPAPAPAPSADLLTATLPA